MTVSTSLTKATYVGNGKTTVFPFYFRLIEDIDLRVIKVDPTGLETDLTIDDDYTVSGSGSNNGGSVTLVSPLEKDYTLIIVREVDINQLINLRNMPSYMADNHEQIFDRLMMVCQQVQEQISRSVMVSVSSTSTFNALLQKILAINEWFKWYSPTLRTRTSYVAEFGQTTFYFPNADQLVTDITFAYRQVDVYMQGVRLSEDEYTITEDGVVLNEAAPENVPVSIISFGSLRACKNCDEVDVDVMQSIADADAGAIGTYAMLTPAEGGITAAFGDEVSGSELYLSSVRYTSNTPIGYGTWKLMSDLTHYGPLYEPCIWLRVA